MVTGVRQGRCEFADMNNKKRKMIWTVGIDYDLRIDKKHKIPKSDLWMLKIQIDDEVCAWFDEGSWKKRPPLFGVARDAYKVVRTLYS